MNGYDLPPMSPDDLKALMGVAGPLFGESRNIEMMTSDNTVVGSHIQDGSMKIKSALEQAEHMVRAHRPPPPQYIPPEYLQQAQYVAPVVVPPQAQITNGVATFVAYPTAVNPVDDGQMMLQFDKKTQDVTNDLLQEISKKLTKIISFLEKQEKENTTPKQKSVKVPI